MGDGIRNPFEMTIGINYQALLYLLNGYLYEEADSFEALIRGYVTANGEQEALMVIREIEEILNGDYDDTDITRFIDANCLYMDEAGGRATLRLIQDTLRKVLGSALPPSGAAIS